ncbi:MAG: TlpA family protein disulfide reductase [Cellulophaga sp.]
MAITRKRIFNIVFYVLIVAIVFTPLGFKVKVFANRIFSGSAAKIEVKEQVTLQNYNWKFTNAKGDVYNLQDYKGKVVLINFWATWCPPCVAEMPSLQKLYTDYQDKVVFVFLASDKVAKVNAYLKENNFSFNVYYSNYKLPKELSHDVIPTTYILSKSGEIVVQETGAKDWNSTKTREILNELLNN